MIVKEAFEEFFTAYEEAYGELPTVFGMTTYDTANVMAQAIEGAEGLTGDELSAALDGLGEIENSPRGPWSFNGQTPEQTVYLREVTDEGGTLINSVVEDLGVFEQPLG